MSNQVIRSVKTKNRPLGEQGNVLPIGISDAKGVSRDIVLKPWRMKEEREIGSLLEKVEGALKVVQYVPSVLAIMCSKLGPYDFEKMKEVERKVVISQMYLADVFFAYLLLRCQAMGNEVVMGTRCPSCLNTNNILADLNTVMVRNVERAEDAVFKFNVKHPFKLRNKDVSELTLGPPRWSTLEQAGTRLGRNLGELKAALIHGAVMGVAGIEGQLVLAVHELDEMRKVDFETLAKAIDVNSVGPDMSLEAQCATCGKSYMAAIDWASEDFFGASSQSRAET